MKLKSGIMPVHSCFLGYCSLFIVHRSLSIVHCPSFIVYHLFMRFIELGRWLFPAPFIIFGLFHFTTPRYYADQLPSYIPAGEWLIKGVGVAMIAAAVSMYLGVKDRWAALFVAALLLVFIGVLHAPTAIGGGEKSQLALAMLFKDLGLMAGALLYAQYVGKN
jgi:putative oxidoreductase